MSDGTIITAHFHYVADADGYLLAVSFGADISCHGQSCVGYYGVLPDGFTSWEAWYASECERLHKWQVVDGVLTEDADASDPVESTDLWVGDNARLRTIGDGRGNLQLYDAEGNLAVNAYANTGGGGEVDVHDTDGTSKAALYVTSGKEGALQLKNADGEAAYLYHEDIEKLKNMTENGPGNSGSGLSMTKLWENASPSSSFAAQTISLDLSGYDMVGIVASSYGGNTKLGMTILPVGFAGYLQVPGAYNSLRYFTSRETGVTFSDCQRYASYGSTSTTTDNIWLIPIEIYGIKGVQ